MNMDRFDVDSFNKLLRSSKMGRKIVYTDLTGSTMDDARRLAHEVMEYPHGTIVISEQQTKARGARDHKWDATNTGNIYASFVLHLSPLCKTFEGRFDVEVAACLAVFQVVQKFGVKNVVPKWPNDLWVRGHKLAGFLVEDGRFDIPGTTSCLCILGMGINVNADVRRSNELQSLATSLVCERGGQYVNREEFLAEVCASLEQVLVKNREENFATFLKENLFQTNCQISVSNNLSGKVLDGMFMAISNNWDVKFIDTQNGEVMRGNSIMYSIRPKVINKILIVFASTHNSRVASTLSKWLTAVTDTSKYNVCLVPQSSLTTADEWMKSCSLLVLAEGVSDTAIVTKKIGLFLKSGGSVMACGKGAHYLASVLHVHLKEVALGSSPDATYDLMCLQTKASSLSPPVSSDSISQCLSDTTPIVHKTCATKSSDDNVKEISLDNLQTVIFSVDPICCHVYDIENSSLLSDIEEELYLVNSLDRQSLSSNSLHSHQTEVKAYFSGAGDQEKMLSVFTGSVKCGGCVALWGFNIVNLSEADHVNAQDIQAVKDDRFKRDHFLQQVLEVVLKS